MASLVKKYTQEKLIGQIFTPEFVISKMLDDIGYNNFTILGKKILDPACGDGRFLIEIVKRIVKFSPLNSLKDNLMNVYGWDIDSNLVKDCLKNLNDIIKPLGININWNIFVTNSISKFEKKNLSSTIEDNEKFDYIVGNPPYIRIQHLDLSQREFIQNNFKFCKKGSTDIYIAFFELSIALLEKNGICALLTPNTFFYTETAYLLRDYFFKNKNIIQITNYGNVQLFKDAAIYSAITIFSHEKRKNFLYQKTFDNKQFENKVLLFDELTKPFWQLSTNKIEQVQGKRLGDISSIHIGITTLCDKVFIFKISDIGNNKIIAHTRFKRDVILEKSIIRPIIKGSTLKSSDELIKEWILFPYKKVNEKNVIIPENELLSEYPLAYKYLLSVKNELDKRDNGKPNITCWYAFGRSQGLDTSFGKKIIFSPMNIKPNFILYENHECTLYSGYYIKYDGDNNKLLVQLNSDRMQKYIDISSRYLKGGWRAYNKKVIENFIIEI